MLMILPERCAFMIGIAALLFWYAWTQEKKGVLR